MSWGRLRLAIQLFEEAILFTVAMVVLAILFGGLDSILKKASEASANMWKGITDTINELFSVLWKW
jgi:hypothetical protein